MTKPKHTPEPWTVDYHSWDEPGEHPNEVVAVSEPNMIQTKYKTVCCFDHDGVPSRADAVLMAMAPELLHALKCAQKTLEFNLCSAAARQIGKVIARAEEKE